MTVDEDPWLRILRPIPRAEAAELPKLVRAVQFSDDASRAWSVPWAWVAGNHCIERTRMTQYALAVGANNEPLPAAMPDAMVERMVKEKRYDAAEIQLQTWMELGQTAFRAPGSPPIVQETSVSWTNHHAALINVEGALHVIDLAVSDKPLHVDDWIATFAALNRVKCSRLSDRDASDLTVYFASRAQSLPIEPSGVLCGYNIVWGYNNSLEPMDGFGSLRWDFTTQWVLKADSDALKETFGRAGATLSEGDVGLVTSTLEQVNDEFCGPAHCGGAECVDLKYTCSQP